MTYKKPGSWFSVWAAKLGVPVAALIAAAVVVGLVVAKFLGFF